MDTLIYELSANTFEEIKRYSVNSICGYYSKVSGSSVVVDSSIVYYHSWKLISKTYCGDAINVIDLKTQKRIAYFQKDNWPYMNIEGVSRNGEFCIVENNISDLHPKGVYLYQMVRPNFNPLLAIADIKRYCFYNKLNSLIVTGNHSIQILELPTLNPITTYSIGCDIYNPTIDLTTDYLGGYTTDRKYRIYDLNTGALVKEINLGDNDEDEGYFLVNSTLFLKSGLFIPVDYN